MADALATAQIALVGWCWRTALVSNMRPGWWGKGVRTLFRAKLARSTGPDVGPRLISGGLPAGGGNLMLSRPSNH
jgi:hypothetical protein